MVKIRLKVVLLCGLLAARASASDSYLCVTDMATGFAFDKSQKQWHSTSFKVSNKYLVSKAQREGYAWEVKTAGSTIALIFCKANFTEAGALRCEGDLQEFNMNKKNLRFLSFYRAGYWTDGTGRTVLGMEGDNTPAIEIGKCSPL